MCPFAEENVSQSFATETTSSYFVIAQKPPPLHSQGCQCTGSRSRRSRNASCGTPFS
jgi:hypothetical protein